MNAIEFVKKFGWGEFKELYQASLYVEPFQPPSEKIIGIKKSEIKELFDAFELVESKGGLVECKSILSQDNSTWCSGGRVYVNPLERAVKIVEQCQ